MGKFRIANAQYPIHFYSELSSWKSELEAWVSEATKNNCRLLMFPEYGGLELLSLFPAEDRSSLQKQKQKSTELTQLILDTYLGLSKKYAVYILTPSIPQLDENKKIVNRCYFTSPSGEYTYQDKIMLTRFEGEELKISPGIPKVKIIDTPFAKIGIAICYDSEFPLISQKMAEKGIDVLLVPSCTDSMSGSQRVHISARARALENQLYVAVSQLVGDSLWNSPIIKCTGYSAFYAPPDYGFPIDGVLQIGQINVPGWIYQDIDTEKVKQTRTVGQVLNYKDSLKLNEISNRLIFESLKV